MASTPNNPQQLNPYGVAGNPNAGGMQDTSSALKGDDLTGSFTAEWDRYTTEQARLKKEAEAKAAAEKKAAADAAAAAAKQPSAANRASLAQIMSIQNSYGYNGPVYSSSGQLTGYRSSGTPAPHEQRNVFTPAGGTTYMQGYGGSGH